MINWMKYRYLYFTLSLLVIIPGIFTLIKYGLRPSIEFTGGSVIELSGLKLTQSEVASRLTDTNIVGFNYQGDYLSIRLKPISQAQSDTILANLTTPEYKPTLLNFETVGPVIGKETLRKTIIGMALAALVILVFVARAFKELKFGVCAVIAMLHDSLVLLGTFAILGHFFNFETDLLFVTAVLTALSFSVHDTIVVYDRIRELTRLHPGYSMEELANKATTETMVRSLNNSLTIIFMLLALVLMGGVTTRGFALALLIGTISGTYSSPFTATPLLVVWDSLKNRKKSH